jgi:hypothetical protein
MSAGQWRYVGLITLATQTRSPDNEKLPVSLVEALHSRESEDASRQ